MEPKQIHFGTRGDCPVSVFHAQLEDPTLSELYASRHGWHNHRVVSDASYAMGVWREHSRYKNGVDLCVPEDTTIAPGEAAVIDLKVTAVCSEWESITPMAQCLRAILLGFICNAVAIDGAPLINGVVNFALAYAFFEMDNAVTFEALCPLQEGPSEGESLGVANPHRNYDPTKIQASFSVAMIGALLDGVHTPPVFVLCIPAVLGHVTLLPRAMCRPSVGFRLVPRSSFYKTGCIQANSVGVIDHGYRGTLHMPIRNVTNAPVLLRRGQFIAQLCGAAASRAVGVYYDEAHAAEIPQIFRATAAIR